MNFFQGNAVCLPRVMEPGHCSQKLFYRVVFILNVYVWVGRRVEEQIITKPSGSIMGNDHSRVTWSLHNHLHIHPKLAAERKQFTLLTFLPLFSGPFRSLIQIKHWVSLCFPVI